MQEAGSGEGHRKRLRMRYHQAGLAAFTPHEVIELLLTLSLPRGDVKPLAKRLHARFGSLSAVMRASREELLEIEGVGEATIFAIRYIRDIIPHFLESEISNQPKPSTESLTIQLKNIWRARIGHEPVEVFEVGLFSPSLRLVKIVTHSRGAVDQTSVIASEIIRLAVKADAFAVAFAHNHPSGSTTPSDVDKLITKQLVLAATSAKVAVIDHFIVSATSSFSFREQGLL